MWNPIKKLMEKPWYAQYEDTWKTRLYNKWIEFVYKVTSRHKWVELVITTLATLECNSKLLKDEELLEKVEVAHCFNKGLDDIIATIYIPENDFYCGGCPFKTRSKIARFFYGEDMDGFCYFLDKGDFSFTNPTDILWDGCKCCGINTDIEEDAEVEEEELTFEDLGIEEPNEN